MTEETKPAKNWGGVRPGGGRPAGRKNKSVTYSLPIEIIEKLEARAALEGNGVSQVVLECLKSGLKKGSAKRS